MCQDLAEEWCSCSCVSPLGWCIIEAQLLLSTLRIIAAWIRWNSAAETYLSTFLSSVSASLFAPPAEFLSLGRFSCPPSIACPPFFSCRMKVQGFHWLSRLSPESERRCSRVFQRWNPNVSSIKAGTSAADRRGSGGQLKAKCGPERPSSELNAETKLQLLPSKHHVVVRTCFLLLGK